MKAPIWSCYFQWILCDLQSGFYRNFYVKISSPDRYSDCPRISKTNNRVSYLWNRIPVKYRQNWCIVHSACGGFASIIIYLIIMITKILKAYWML